MPLIAPTDRYYAGAAALSKLYLGADLLWQSPAGPNPVSVAWAGANTAVAGTGLSGSAPAPGAGAAAFGPISPGYVSDPVLSWASTATSIAGAVTADAYVDFVVNRASAWNPKQLAFAVAAGGATNTRGWGVATSADGYTARTSRTTTTIRPTLEAVTIDLSPLGTIPGNFTVRIYAYGGGTTRSVDFDNITVTGTAP